jgi:hypothetical protein
MPGLLTNHANVATGEGRACCRQRAAFLSIPVHSLGFTKSNKTERFQISFDFAHAVPTTYDEAFAGRSIFDIRSFSKAWKLELGVSSSPRRLTHRAFLYPWLPQRYGSENEYKMSTFRVQMGRGVFHFSSPAAPRLPVAPFALCAFALKSHNRQNRRVRRFPPIPTTLCQGLTTIKIGVRRFYLQEMETVSPRRRCPRATIYQSQITIHELTFRGFPFVPFAAFCKRLHSRSMRSFAGNSVPSVPVKQLHLGSMPNPRGRVQRCIRLPCGAGLLRGRK